MLLVGAGHGGVLAAELAASAVSDAFTVDAVITAGSPSAHVPRIPDSVRVLSLEDRDDPVALLGSLVNAGAANRTDIVFDASGAAVGEAYVVGARAADEAAVHHPDLAAELDRLRTWGYLGHPVGVIRRAPTPPPGRMTQPRGVPAQTRSCTNSPSWVRLRHSTIGTTSPYFPATESPVSQCRWCSGLSHHECRAAPAIAWSRSRARSL